MPDTYIPTHARCGDCGAVNLIDDLLPYDNIYERVDIGGIMPAGACPAINMAGPGPHEECGALCYLIPVPRLEPCEGAERPNAEQARQILCDLNRSIATWLSSVDEGLCDDGVYQDGVAQIKIDGWQQQLAAADAYVAFGSDE